MPTRWLGRLEPEGDLILGHVHDRGAMAFLRLDLDALVSLAERNHQSLIVVLAEVGCSARLFETVYLLQLALYFSPRHVLLGRPAGDPDDNALGLRQELFLIG